MGGLSRTQIYVAENVLLDARLALFHKRERWLAIADLHYGFELSQRAAGRLVPMWGMESASARLLALIAEYTPERLIMVGDLVHDDAARAPLRELLTRVSESCEVIAIAGNHDRKLRGIFELRDSFRANAFEFHHGDCELTRSGYTQIIGHFHPAATLRDGAGLRLKFPAFVQEESCWILPAFSPWSAGTEWRKDDDGTRIWVCTPQRIFSPSFSQAGREIPAH
ncbi:MAG: metallophosphoesterase [Chthoniobacterales bacterium]